MARVTGGGPGKEGTAGGGPSVSKYVICCWIKNIIYETTVVNYLLRKRERELGPGALVDREGSGEAGPGISRSKLVQTRPPGTFSFEKRMGGREIGLSTPSGVGRGEIRAGRCRVHTFERLPGGQVARAAKEGSGETWTGALRRARCLAWAPGTLSWDFSKTITASVLGRGESRAGGYFVLTFERLPQGQVARAAKEGSGELRTGAL